MASNLQVSMPPARAYWIYRFLLAALSAALVGLGVVCAGGVVRYYFETPCKCRATIPLVDHEKLATAIDALAALAQDVRAETGRLPDSWDALEGDLTRLGWTDRIPSIGLPPLDPWGHLLQYEVGGESLSLRSLGRDGKVGGTAFETDVEWPRAPDQRFELRVPLPEERSFERLLVMGELSGAVAAVLCLFLPRPRVRGSLTELSRAALVRGGIVLGTGALVDALLIPFAYH